MELYIGARVKYIHDEDGLFGTVISFDPKILNGNVNSWVHIHFDRENNEGKIFDDEYSCNLELLQSK
jgi:hypothetical protein